MVQNTNLFLFGDQTFDFVPVLRRLLSVQDHVILGAFLDQSHHVIRSEGFKHLTPAEYKLARSSSLAQLLQKYAAGGLNPAFQTALSCISQIACFIRSFEDPAKTYPGPTDTYILGVCTGSLAAAAISCARSLSELLPLAVQTVTVAFRLGFLAYTTRRNLDGEEVRELQPWSMVVNGMDFNAASSFLQTSAKLKALPQSRRPWMSAASARTTTISGTPTALKAVRDDVELAKLKIKDIPIYAPSHNPDLFSQENIDFILEETEAIPWSHYASWVPFLSSVTGKLVWTSDFRGTLQVALQNCLRHPIRWDLVESELPPLLKSRSAAPLHIVTVLSPLHRSLAAASKAVGIDCSTAELHDEEKDNVSHRPGAARGKLAIVGMSGRFPESETLDEFWQVLYKGVDTCKEVPRKRWDVATHVDPSGKARNKGATPWGCWLDFSGKFDPRFFSISPKEAPQMDPAQRMALMSTWEAMERAGLVADTTPSTQRNRIGVFHGVTSNDWMETNTAQNIDTYFITGGNRGFIPGRINFCFEFSGPSYSNDTACSSSLAAIHLACNSLWRGDVDTAVAGGTNMIYTPDGHTGLDKGFFLSRTGNCKPFDDNADGYCRAEGVGTVLIKRLEDALADHDPIIGVILDAKTNHSAMSESMTRPHVGAQVENMTAVLDTSGVKPSELSYIEMHGTGTQVGDAVEMESVINIFAPNETARPADKPLYVGSAKANIGHGEGVSGVSSLVKVLLMMQKDTIVPHCGIKPGSRINRHYPDLGARNVHIALEPKAWPRPSSGPRRVLINNFSAAGGNTALLIEDAPVPEAPSSEDPRDSYIVALSGHVGKSLQANLQSLLGYLESERCVPPINQLSYTTTARRWHFPHRVSVVGTTIDEVKEQLRQAIKNGDGVHRPRSKPKVLFAFTGQGSQYVGMGKQLYDTVPRFRAELEHFDQLARSQGFPSFLRICTSAAPSTDALPVVTQLAIVCLEMALSNLLQSWGVHPGAVVGHSLGEYAALYAAGVCAAADVIFLVGKRAELLQERCQQGTHAMLAVKESQEDVSQLLRESSCEVACVNGPNDVVLSGALPDVLAAQKSLVACGKKCTLLELPFAFHSSQVDPILEEFECLANSVPFHSPRIPILSPLLGTLITDAGTVTGAYLARHCRESVKMVEALRYAEQKGLVNEKSIVVEVGPKPLICSMVKASLGNNYRPLPTLKAEGSSWKAVHAILSTAYNSGAAVDWVAYQSSFESAKRVLDLPTYGWDLQEYYIPYQGDWCLHRHDTKCDCARPGTEVATSDYRIPEPGERPTNAVHQPLPKPEKAEAPYPKIQLTTTIHKVHKEETEPLGATMTVETDMCRPDVIGFAGGHVVDGVPLVTPSLYADIALHMGKYSMDRIRAGHPSAIDGIVEVSNMVVENALIAHGQPPQLLHTTLTMKWPPKAAATARSAKLAFSSYTTDGKLETHHGTCNVRFTTDSQRKTLELKVDTYNSRIRALREGLVRGLYTRYSKKSGYKLMSNMAHFHPDYKILDDLVMDEENNEATCKLDLTRAPSSEGVFAAHPAHLDGIMQLAGFTMNAQDATDTDKEMYVNHGWESFQLYKPLERNRIYDVYTKMERGPQDDLRVGNIVVLHGSEPVAFFKGLSLRRVARKGLQAVLKSGLDRATRLRGGNPAPVAAKPKPPAAPLAQTRGNLGNGADVRSERGPNGQPPLATPSGQVDVKSGFAKVLTIIAEESGIAVEELTEDSEFADMGIDSLNSMVIGSRFREELGLNLPPEFSLFVDCATVKSLRLFWGGLTGAAPQDDVGSGNAVEESGAPDAPTTAGPAAETRAQDKVEAPDGRGNFSMALEIVAQESGVAADQLLDATTEFAEIGIDSLNAMVISSRFREELGVGVKDDFSFFDDVPTVSALMAYFGTLEPGRTTGKDADARGRSSVASPSPTLSSGAEDEDDDDGEPASAPSSQASSTSDTPPSPSGSAAAAAGARKPYCRPTSSVVLQGLPRLAQRTMFLLPDGGGSASSYLPIPRLRGDTALVGLNCPYARDPERMDCTHVALVESFCAEIRRRQPRGPYHLGGWSSGGAFAFVVAEALVRAGDEVHSLVVVDAPVPAVMEKLPDAFYEHCNRIGLFANQPGGSADGDTRPPSYLIPHFQATVDVMLDYKVAPLQTSRMPKVGLLWAADTVLEEGDAPKIAGMHFMVQKRTDFGPDGWDTVMPGAEFDIVKATGANHFTLLSKKHVHLVRDLIDRVMSD